MLIRNAQLTDAEDLIAFNQAMAIETEGKKLDEKVLSQGVQAVLKDAGKGQYLVAEADGKLLASLMVTFEWSDWRNANIWWVQSVYVLPEARRQGLYSKLYQHVQLQAKAAQAAGIRLYVEQDNDVAQATYRHLGMQQSHYLLFEQA